MRQKERVPKTVVSRREQLREIMIENAAEINRLYGRIKEAVRRRDQSDEARLEWSQACEEFHARYNSLCFPGGWDAGFVDRLRAGDRETVEAALCFLEVRPYFFRSGYHWKTLYQKCKRAPMTGEQAERFASLVEKYEKLRRQHRDSSQRGEAVRLKLWPLFRCFYDLFPRRIPDAKLDGLVTVGDLYRVLCHSLKLEPYEYPEKQGGIARKPGRPTATPVSPSWASEYQAWLEFPWRADDVWATLTATIADVYKTNRSAITPETILAPPTGQPGQ